MLIHRNVFYSTYRDFINCFHLKTLRKVTLKRLSPDGRYLAGFNHYCLELFEFQGADSACRTGLILDQKRIELEKLSEDHRNGEIRYHEYEQRFVVYPSIYSQQKSFRTFDILVLEK